MADAIVWKGDLLELLDQRILPRVTRYLHFTNVDTVAKSITEMVVRGAPAIGVTAAYGLVLALKESKDPVKFDKSCETLARARPTAVNLFDAIEHMRRELLPLTQWDDPAAQAETIAIRYHQDDLAKNREIGRHGASFLEGKRSVLTHCNAGALATSGWGTALGVVRQLHAENRLHMVFADETRPFLQGARLTIWECQQDGLPAKLITDGMGGYFMAQGQIDCVVVGADRIASNGDVANKIGTFMVAMAARYHGIPFVVAAPTTTLDYHAASGADIPIEQRNGDEIRNILGHKVVDADVDVANPAFDITPAELVTAIITEDGIYRPPYRFEAPK